jgi:uncharacterized protein (DUF1501 family)
MHFIDSQKHTRRAFLKRSGQLALTGTALPMALNLAAMGEAAAFNAPSGDYKALVCVFLYGGNDYANTVVPYDNASYDKYSAIRGGGAGRTAGGIALGQAEMTTTLLNPTLAPVDSLGVARQFALHPSMAGMASLFNTGKAAVQLNVGPLVVPLTRAQYNSTDRKTYPRPPQLFSHNDQQSIWQSSSPEGSKVGWGGNLGDLAIANGLNSNSLFTCMSVTGNAVFLSGDTALQYQLSTNGAIKINPATSAVYGSTAVRDAIATLVQQQRSHVLENEYNTVTRRAITAETQVSAALAGLPPATVFPADGLGPQMKMVARLIKGRAALGARRQVFLVSIGGFDLHDNLIRDHDGLLGKVSAGMKALYDATVELGVADQVTAFTASDFGRTLASNGDGSDHGWGSHHFVVGGAVKGQAFYGTPPPVSVSDTKDTAGNYRPENQWHVGQGRLLPSTSVDQYAATLARWFGVDGGELSGILPNLGHFGGNVYPVNMGFLG